MNRRTFLQGTGVLLAAGATGAHAIEPIARVGRSHMRLSFAAYSYRQFLDLRRKPRPEMTLDDFIDQTAEMPFDAVADFVPVALTGVAPLILVANNALPVNSIGEFVAYAKARPGQLNFGSSTSTRS